LRSSRDTRPPRIVVYGVAGIGKTTFAACAPSPVAIWTEDGAGTLDIAGFPKATSFADVLQALGVLYAEEHPYKTLIVDSLDWLEPLIWEHVCAQNGKKSIEDFGFGKGYLAAMDAWRQFLDGVNAVRDKKNMAVVLIAHHRVKRFDSPETEPYDRYEMKLHDRASALVQEHSDIIGFANYRVMTTSTDAGFNNKVRRGIGTGERLLHLVEKPAFVAKNRYGMPESIPLDWGTFAALVPTLSNLNTPAAPPTPEPTPKPKQNKNTEN
jgi:hypothetical protein